MDINKLDQNGDSPPHAAASAGNIEAVTELLGRGAYKVACNKDGLTPYQMIE
jgi:ankyrin repeat protein